MNWLSHILPFIGFKTFSIDWDEDLVLDRNVFTGFCADVLMLSWLGYNLALYRGKIRRDTR